MHPLFAEIFERHFLRKIPQYDDGGRRIPEPAPDEPEEKEQEIEIMPIAVAIQRGIVGDDEITPDVVSLRRVNVHHPQYLPSERGYLIFKNGEEKRLY